MVVTGRTLGRFRLEHELGSGGHGRVWSAVDTLLGDSVALKVLHPELVNEGDAKERLKREVVLARRVQHRGICRVNDLHEIDGTLVISMQLAPGVDLDALLEQQQLSVTRALRIIDRIADAVAAAHDEDVIHRDLKPSNIIVDDNDDIVVLDFGIASASDLGRLTEPGVVVGTRRFVAPEVLETARASARSDLYAIGVVGWALLAGRLPWGRPASVMQLLNDLERGPPDLRAVNPAVPVAVANVILTAMSRDPDDRYADVKSFQRALALAASSLVSTSTPTAAASPAPRAQATQIVRSRNKPQRDFSPTTETFSVPSRVAPAPSSNRNVVMAAAGAVGAIVVVGALVGVALWQQKPPAPPPAPATLNAAPVVSAPVAAPPATPTAMPAAEAVAEGAAVADDPDGATAGKPVRSAADRELAQATARARTLGLRRGDAPSWDAASSSAHEALRKAPDAAGTLEAARKASAAVNAVVVDHAFVTAKLQRFNTAVDAAIKRDPKMRDKVMPASSSVAKAYASRDPAAANRALNAAFAVLDRR